MSYLSLRDSYQVYFNGSGFEGAHFVRDFVEILIGRGYIARKLNGDTG